MVVLHQNNPQDENALHFELEYDGELELEANLIEGNHTFLLANPSRWIMDQEWFDVSFFYLDALDSVAGSSRGRTTILPLLQGTLMPKIDYARYERTLEELAGTGLNQNQAEAVAQVMLLIFYI
jgi:hypothetical protein